MKYIETTKWDIVIVGGGATGLGIAIDAASRGFKTLLLERYDFAKGTSSRSTKLVHGGVRYLAQGDIKLVYSALKERGLLLQNAPHLVKKQAFVIPCYSWFGVLKYAIGLKLYDWLAGKFSFGRSIYLSKTEIVNLMPGINPDKLVGGVRYYDGQFDDARLALNLAQTAKDHGATLLNYVRVTGLIKNNLGHIEGLTATDVNNINYQIQAKSVINATGVFVDDLLQMDEPSQRKLVRSSQGVHIVLPLSFLNSEQALMIPKTTDGRVLFAIPWHNHLLVGTTDTPLPDHSIEPEALESEIDFILNTAGKYLNNRPDRKDILSVFAGLRPLAAPQNNTNSTKEISRDHKLIKSNSGLITITGGKWTTYRKMAEETVDLAIKTADLPAAPCRTTTLPIHGYEKNIADGNLSLYGSDGKGISALISESPELAKKLDDQFPYTLAQVVWAVKHEMAETVEDVLARRIRVLFLDAHAAIRMAPIVAAVMATELNRDEAWQNEQVKEFNILAQQYLPVIK